MISESKTPPILLPIWIDGMNDVCMEKFPYLPKFGKVCHSRFSAIFIENRLDC